MEFKLSSKNNFYLFLLFLTLGLIWIYFILSPLKSLPSPIFGGDYYNHLGILNHLYAGGSFFESAQLSGEIPWVPRFHHLIVFVFGKLFNLDPLTAWIWQSIFIFPLFYSLAYYFIGRKIGAENFILFSIVFLASFPIFKYTDFAATILMPFYAIVIFNFVKKPSLKNALLLALVFGIGSNTNVQLAAVSFLLILLLLILSLFRKNISPDIPEIKPTHVLLSLALTFLLALVYWHGPIFIKSMHVLNKLHIYGWADFSNIFVIFGYGFNSIIGNILHLNITTLFFLYFLYYFYTKRSSKNYLSEPTILIPLIILVAIVISAFHPLVTFTLAKVHFAPERLVLMLSYLLAYFSILYIPLVRNNKYIFFLLLVSVLIIGYHGYTSFTSSKYYTAGLQSLPDIPFLSAEEWIKNNTDVDTVFLSSKEEAFAFNALTGRKFMDIRWTHTSIYADMQQRDMDAAIILYGNNDEKTTELLNKYNVSYFLLSNHYPDLLYKIDEKGAISGIFDPFLAQNTPENLKYIEKYDVPYMRVYSYMDPAWVPNYPKYNLLLFGPKYNSTDLFSPVFVSHLEYVVSFEDENGEYIAIYKVRR